MCETNTGTRTAANKAASWHVVVNCYVFIGQRWSRWYGLLTRNCFPSLRRQTSRTITVMWSHPRKKLTLLVYCTHDQHTASRWWSLSGCRVLGALMSTSWSLASRSMDNITETSSWSRCCCLTLSTFLVMIALFCSRRAHQHIEQRWQFNY